jgi:hypothetical protein
VANDYSSLEKCITELRECSGPADLVTLQKLCESLRVRGHLAVITEPYLSKLLSGQKSIESRFSQHFTVPHGKVRSGDLLFFKVSSGPIEAVAQASEVLSFGPLEEGAAKKLMEQFQDELALEDDFVRTKQNSRYATLVRLSSILPTNVRVNKTDRRAWVVLEREDIRQEEYPVQLALFANPDCERGLHTYRDSKVLASIGGPICKYCGASVVDWKRVQRRDIGDLASTLADLQTEKLRYDWWTREIDDRAMAHARREGLSGIRSATLVRLRSSVGKVYDLPDGSRKPYRDGYQTPYSGNVIYYAQHALACCCRKCMEYWHGIPNNRELTEEELIYFTELVIAYVCSRIPDFVRANQDRTST